MAEGNEVRLMSEKDGTGEGNCGLRAYVFIALLAFASKALGLWMLFPENGWKDLGYGWELGQVAANIAQGNGMSSPFKQGDVPTAWFMPVTPLLWGMVFTIFGIFSKSSLIALYAFDCVLRAVAGCVYLKLVCALLPKGSGRAAVVITSIALIAPEHLVALTRPWYWGLQEVGVALMLLCGLRWARSNRLQDAAKLGVVSGLTLLVNSVPVLLLGALLAQAIVRAYDVKRSILGSLVVVLISFGFLAPWITRNYSVFDAFVPFRQNTWVEMRQGNNPDGSIIQSRHSLHPNVLPIEKAKYEEQGERAYEANARKEALDYITTHVGITLNRTVLRAAFFWLSDLFHEGVYGDRQWSEKLLNEKARDVWTFLWAVIPLLVVVTGLCRACRGNASVPWILVTPIIVLPIPYYLSHIHPVYFASVKPLLLLLAGMIVCGALRKPAGGK